MTLILLPYTVKGMKRKEKSMFFLDRTKKSHNPLLPKAMPNETERFLANLSRLPLPSIQARIVFIFSVYH